MIAENERRREKRIRFHWPVWFGYVDNGDLFSGQAVDCSTSGVSFLVGEDQCPAVGQHIITRFSFPRDNEDKFALGNYLHWSEVIRVDQTWNGRRRVALRLHRPITFAPAKPQREEILAAQV